jgi:hypothetical protein
MLRTKSWLGTSAAVAALLVGMLTIGCGGSDDSGGGSKQPVTPPTEPAKLEGVWKAITDDGTVLFDIKEDKTFETKVNGNQFIKGTYTAVSPNYTLTITHVHGAAVNAQIEDYLGSEIKIDAKWYTKEEFKSAVIEAVNEILPPDLGGGFGEDEFEEGFGFMFEPQVGTYILNGDKLGITRDGIVDANGKPSIQTFDRQK